MSFLGTQELLIILLVAVVVVGPKRLPDLAKNLGKGIRNFKQATAKMRSELDESGALDEINQLRDQVKGIASEVDPLLKANDADATSMPHSKIVSAEVASETPDPPQGEPAQIGQANEGDKAAVAQDSPTEAVAREKDA